MDTEKIYRSLLRTCNVWWDDSHVIGSPIRVFVVVEGHLPNSTVGID